MRLHLDGKALATSKGHTMTEGNQTRPQGWGLTGLALRPLLECREGGNAVPWLQPRRRVHTGLCHAFQCAQWHSFEQ